eukprot:PhF_6_TR42808/c0_g1_i3/m.64809
MFDSLICINSCSHPNPTKTIRNARRPARSFLLPEILAAIAEYMDEQCLLSASAVSWLWYHETCTAPIWDVIHATKYHCCPAPLIVTREVFFHTAYQHSVMKEFRPVLRYIVAIGTVLLYISFFVILTGFGSGDTEYSVLKSLIVTVFAAPVVYILYLYLMLALLQYCHPKWGQEIYRITDITGVRFNARHLFQPIDFGYFMASAVILIAASFAVPIAVASYVHVGEFLQSSKYFYTINATGPTSFRWDGWADQCLYSVNDVYMRGFLASPPNGPPIAGFMSSDEYTSDTVPVKPGDAFMIMPGKKLLYQDDATWGLWNSGECKGTMLLALQYPLSYFTQMRSYILIGIVIWGSLGVLLTSLNCAIYVWFRPYPTGSRSKWYSRVTVYLSITMLFVGGLSAVAGGWCLHHPGRLCAGYSNANTVTVIVAGTMCGILSVVVCFMRKV